jgi:hypothetical protein
MGMAGKVRLGKGVIRALPAALDCELELDESGLPVAIAFDLRGDQTDTETTFDLYPDLADAIAQDGGLDELD